MNDNLEHLWIRVLDGDRDAWRQLVELLTPLVMAVARRNGLDQADAEDCVQYTWLSLYRQRESLKEPIALPGWLIRVAVRRSQRMLKSTAAEERRWRECRQPEETPSPDLDIERLQRAGQVRLAIENLDRRCRDLMWALFFESDEISYRDIAERLGIPLNSLGPTRSRCLEKLRMILEDYEI
ncbi:MAG TPA: sigma-70 family RNA polymerase sigma factor [candidate division Zixibacteria bacterium]|nr:sigma-70 family RNA polymerase sigma factor [candidate division Zixibacteria bacterium]